ncbi:MAG TPA: DUF3870 domain-containing protein [Clostridia bacterium]|nr:DUF3870 domain-containing protein [Clostridia bacterium]
MALPQDRICVVGLSKTGAKNPITKVHQSLVGSFVIQVPGGEILEVEFNTILPLTSDFLTQHFVGKNLLHDIDDMASFVLSGYMGDSRRAIISILKDARCKLENYLAAVKT